MKPVTFLICLLLVVEQLAAQPITRYERRLIAQGKPNEKMRVTLITNPNDLKILRTVSARVEKPNHRVWQHLIGRMLATVQHPDHKGVGIAAPQVGINRKIILVQRFDKEGQAFEAYFNPEILRFSDSLHLRIEGCLSIPVTREAVQRPWGIWLRYQERSGAWREEYVEGFTARIFQHEIDHLNGLLFTDKLSYAQ
jgi:peptide deformylase